MLTKWTLISFSLMALISVNVQADNEKPLIFEAVPTSKINDSVKFESCGYQFRAVIDENNWHTLLQVDIAKHLNNSYYISTGYAKKLAVDSEWVPKSSIVQWVKVGSAQAIKLNPYNLMAIASRGTSSSFTKMPSDFNIIKEVEKRDSILWVRIFDKTDNVERTYSGPIILAKGSAEIIRDCLSNLNGA